MKGFHLNKKYIALLTEKIITKRVLSTSVSSSGYMFGSINLYLNYIYLLINN